MKEEIFFECPNAKVTNLRFYCNGTTFLINHIDTVYINHRVWRMFSAFMCFLFSFLTLAAGIEGLLFITLAFIWLFYEYIQYAELWILVNGKKKKVDHCNFSEKERLYRIEDAINEAKNENTELAKSGNLQVTDSMKFQIKMGELES